MGGYKTMKFMNVFLPRKFSAMRYIEYSILLLCAIIKGVLLRNCDQTPLVGHVVMTILTDISPPVVLKDDSHTPSDH